MVTLHERIAKVLGWSVVDVRKFSLGTLREILRGTSPKLAAEITECIRSGRVLTDGGNK